MKAVLRMETKLIGQIKKMKALADETRLQIVLMLAGGELCACKIQEKFNFTQPTLSYHMKILTDCGLVRGRREGAWMRYTLNKAEFNNMAGFIGSINENIELTA
jgi:ArsR family transcriptional regulator, arsenate/arsenite/antimonite-responsive transcriptional repressor